MRVFIVSPLLALRTLDDNPSMQFPIPHMLRPLLQGVAAAALFAGILCGKQALSGELSAQVSDRGEIHPAQESARRKESSGKPPTPKQRVKDVQRGLPPADTGRVIARIDGKSILIDEFIRRSEYTVRPSYCRGNGGFEKKIVLNSLLAEKMLAREAGNNNALTRNPSFQRMMQGRKEQLMREVLYYAEGTARVRLDSSELRRENEIAGRTYHLEYFDVPNDSVATTVKRIIDTSASSFAAVYQALSGQDTIPRRDVDWSSRESKSVHKALFTGRPAAHQILGPLRVGEGHYLFVRVVGWTDRVAVSEKQKIERWDDVTETMTRQQADELYEKFVTGTMAGKTLEFDPAAFKQFVEAAAPYYLNAQNTREEAALSTMYRQNAPETPSLSDVEQKLGTLKGPPLFSIDGHVWTMEDVIQEIEKHPLVFREGALRKSNIAEQLELAIVDMVRDRYLSNESYKRGYDSYGMVTHTTEMWEDAMLSLWQEQAYLNSIGNPGGSQLDLVTKYLDPYVDSLRHKYGATVEVNVDEFNNIQLTGIDMIALQRSVPFPVVVPPFPLLTTHKWLDFGKAMGSPNRGTETHPKAPRDSLRRSEH